MEKFTETYHCRSSEKCYKCRDLEGGRAWRESLSKVFELPGGVVDFECPHGKPWGFAGKKPKLTINQLAARKRGCKKCNEKK